MCNTFSEVDRIGGLSQQLCSEEDKEQACEYLLSFIVAGLERLVANNKQNLSHSLSVLNSLNPLDNTPEK
ncbi:hypothetical protein LPW36_16820 [Jinshanibacter sp. LJY008]|uniref:Uncharacterized protein n=1 Tax=Limnobaculum eriocheiris TaxID=2897391 RepID=A0A9X1SM73_9GAMM|nr:hypothetical protein [Limnobaculum eriocheiris]MCD1127625.1 hypothetical protein [Limnobaculum eriocheiris]